MVELEFIKALREVEGNVTKNQDEIAYAKFIKSRNWDKLHPVFEDGVLQNPVPTMDKAGYMQFFKAFNKIANNKNNQHLALSLVQ